MDWTFMEKPKSTITRSAGTEPDRERLKTARSLGKLKMRQKDIEI